MATKYKVGDYVRVLDLADNRYYYRNNVNVIGQVFRVVKLWEDGVYIEVMNVNGMPHVKSALDERVELMVGYVPAAVEAAPAAIMPAKAPKRAQEPRKAKAKGVGAWDGKYVPGMLILVVSNDRKIGFNPANWYNDYVGNGKMLTVDMVGFEPNKEYQKVFTKEYPLGYLDSSQIMPALRKDGKPRVPRKPAKPKPEPKGKSLLNKLVKKVNGTNGTCHFAKRYVKGDDDLFVSAACHASIPSFGRVDVKEIALELASHLKHSKDKDTYRKYVDYIIKRSPVSYLFKKRRVKDYSESGVCLNLDYTLSELMGACVALREGSEFPQKLNTFKQLLDAGYSEDVSWFVSRFYKYNGGNSYAIVAGSGHDCMTSSGNLERTLAIFKKRKLHTYGALPYNEGGDAFSIYSAFAGENGGRFAWVSELPIGKSITGVFPKGRIAGEGFKAIKVCDFDCVKQVADIVAKMI